MEEDKPDTRWEEDMAEGDEGNPVFPVRPPSWVLKTIGWMFVSLFMLVLIISVAVPLPETVTCPFVVFPEAGADPVQSPVGGTIEKVPVKEGSLVKKGDVLFLIRSKETTQDIGDYHSAEQDLAGFIKQKASLKIEGEAQIQASAAEMDSLTLRRDQLTLETEQARKQALISRDYFDSSVEVQQSKINQSVQEAKFYTENYERYQSILKKFETLLTKDYISKLDYVAFQMESSKASLNAETAKWGKEQAELNLKQMKVDRRKDLAQEELRINQLQSEHAQVLASIDRLQNENAANEANLNDRLRAVETEIEKARLRIHALGSQLADSDMSLLRITSPYEGIVLDLTRHNPGDVVSPGQNLCEIAGTQGPFHAEMRIPEKSIAKVRPGQLVKLLFTAYPYQRYGIRRGFVQWVSPGTVTVEGGKEFLAFATLSEQPRAGSAEKTPVQPGMKGDARIIVGTRTLIEFVFEPLRALKENFSRSDSAP